MKREESLDWEIVEPGHGTLAIALSDAVAPEGASPETFTTLAVAQALDDARTTSILERLPRLASSLGQIADFARRQDSPPPPRTGVTHVGVFPPVAEPVAVPSALREPFEVVRYAPEGAVSVAPHVSATFSQDMVPLSVHDAIAHALPLRMEPEVPGTWRWIGTRTIVFEPKVRLPMSTVFKVAVDPAARSVDGNALSKPVVWTFQTPPLSIDRATPQGSLQPLERVLVLAFNQRVDVEKLRAHAFVRVNDREVPFRLASEAEVQGDVEAARLVANALAGTWMALKLEQKVEPSSKVEFGVRSGAPSSEGPLKAVAPQSRMYSTYGRFALVQARCGWNGDRCEPLQPWSVEFTNPIDAETFDANWIRVDPPLEGMKVEVGYNTLNITGLSQGSTEYAVEVASSLRDVFGQSLESPAMARIKVGPAAPNLLSNVPEFAVLDPLAPPVLQVWSVNYPRLKVRVHRVEPKDWGLWRELANNDRWDADISTRLPGTLAFERTLEVKGQADALAQTDIDLKPALNQGGKGQLVVLVSPEGATTPKDSRDEHGEEEQELWERDEPQPRLLHWVQVTELALDAFVDHADITARVSNLKDGKPVPRVNVALSETGASVQTDASGTASLALLGGQTPALRRARVLAAQLGDDVVILPHSLWDGASEGWRPSHPGHELRYHIFDDRGIYRPGEQVRVKGWVRRWELAKGGQMALVPDNTRFSWTAVSSQGDELGKGTVTPSNLGGFDIRLELAKNANLGHASLRLEPLSSPGGGAYHTFQIQEFRRPEYEVSVNAVTPPPHILGQAAIVRVAARYYAGDGLASAPVQWLVRTSCGHYTPPGRDDYTFGEWTPWWRGPFHPNGRDALAQAHHYSAHTDQSGEHALRIAMEAMAYPQPIAVEAEATVSDVNRQAWTARHTLLVHPSTLYVGMRTSRTFVERGQSFDVDLVAVDLDGVALPGRAIEVRAVRREWRQVKGAWVEEVAETQNCGVQSGSDGGARCTFQATDGGVYRIVAQVRDEEGRINQSAIRLWVSGGQVPMATKVEKEQAQLIPDARDYRPGQIARVLVQAPFFPASGILTLRRQGVVHVESFQMSAPTHILDISLVDAHVPNLEVQVDLTGAVPRRDAQGERVDGVGPRPAYASATLNLPVSPQARRLALTLTPGGRELEPGAKTEILVDVRDHEGQAVPEAEVALIVVDEAVLALTGYEILDPMSVFYAAREGMTQSIYLREHVVLADMADMPGVVGVDHGGGAPKRMMRGAALPMAAAAPSEAMAAMESDDDADGAIRMRTNFDALALFEPALRTGADGRTRAQLTLPDNLTRYRVMAVAAASGHRFGHGRAEITARLPLMARISAPRFLNWGDRVELPVVVQNQTDAPMTVDVALRAFNASVLAPQGKRIEVAARDRVEVRFAVATESAGKALFQVAVQSGAWRDAAEASLPVWTPATTEAFATYGEMDEGAVRHELDVPKGVFTQFGGLEVTTASTALQALTDAFIYLVEYPFGCSEQVASRILATAALRDVLGAFEAEGLPTPEALKASMQGDIAHLVSLQEERGGFALWRRGEPHGWPFAAVHATHALVRARAKGYEVPEGAMKRSRGYLQKIERHIPSTYSPSARHAVEAYALYVRQLMGEDVFSKATQLATTANIERELSLESVGWLLSVIGERPDGAAARERLVRHVRNRTTETAATAQVASSYGESADYLLFYSERRGDALVLQGLMASNPADDLIVKLVRGLLGHRKKGRWANTQENAFVLLALERYFNTYEKATPDFVARAWLGDDLVASDAFKGRSTAQHHVMVPMSFVASGAGKRALVVAKSGPGRLYYRLGLRYAPEDLDLPAVEHGMGVARTYEAVDAPQDVRREEDGTWVVRAGARVRVRLTLLAPSTRYHVALVDALPAGLEALNPALATTEALPVDDRDGAGDTWWWRPWFDHQNLRDERVEAFGAYVWAGSHSYSYVARATTPGQFIVPPARAEEMYHPETFGRSATERMLVR